MLAGYMLAMQHQAAATASGSFSNGGYNQAAQQASVNAPSGLVRPPQMFARIKARLNYEAKKREDLLEAQALHEYYLGLEMSGLMS
eukprot:904731-Pleurochrysis_carterae.AAC.1